MYLFTQKPLCQWNARKCNIKEDFNQKWQPQYFIEYKAISNFFAGINHQYMDIYHTKKQTENIPRSCSYLLLKTLFHFIAQCTLVPYLESGLCKLDKELENCNFTFIQSKKQTY